MASSAHPALRILHLSDTHLFGDGSKHYGVVDTVDHLQRALAHVSDQSFDLVVCSGDVSEDGSEASYELARDMIVPWAAERGARAIFAMGNHDSRAEFRAVLGDGQPGTDDEAVWLENDGDGIDASAVEPAPIASAVTVNGWRTIVLDTSVPGAGYGKLGSDQLDFLSAVLAEPAGHGTIIVMHHPPIDAQTDLLRALALDQASVAEFWKRVFAIGGANFGESNTESNRTDVRAILSGHYHHPTVETVGGIPVIVAPGVANIARAFGSPAEESSSDSFGGAVIEVSARRVRVVPFIEPVTGEEVFHFSKTQVQQIIAAASRPGAS